MTAQLHYLYPATASAAPRSDYRRRKLLDKYASLLRGRRALTAGEIKALAWALNGVKACSLTDNDRRALLNLVRDSDPRPITKEQTKFGLAWLKRVAFRADGTPRQTKNQPFGERELEIIRNFRRFAWVGYKNRASPYGLSPYRQLVPVWRCYAKDGDCFDYYVLTGGPGGSVEVVVC